MAENRGVIHATIGGVPPDAFSLPQILGYLAFVFGVASFLQKRDDRMKMVNSVQVTFYAVHYLLLQQPSSAASNAIGLSRNLLSLYTNSKWMALPLLVATALFAKNTVHTWTAMIPIASTILSIYGMFWLKGIPFRLCMLACTVMWLANGILARSYGGTLLEATIAAANIYTITRLSKENGMASETER